MISVCIPSYNVFVERVIKALVAEKEKITFPVEIIVMDDFSNENIARLNQKICSQHGITFIRNERNAGRIAIRRYLAEAASFDFLLFIDGDCYPLYPCFLRIYSLYIDGSSVVYGGGLPSFPSERHKVISYLYKKKRHFKKPLLRVKKPYHHFHTDNFLVARDTFFKNWKFPELPPYGYEDFLFAANLFKNKIKILHIDNPVVHALKSNEDFLKDIDTANESLIAIYFFVRRSRSREQLLPRGVRYIRLLRWLAISPLLPVFKIISKTARKMIVISPGILKLFFLDVYRFCNIIILMKRKKHNFSG